MEVYSRQKRIRGGDGNLQIFVKLWKCKSCWAADEQLILLVLLNFSCIFRYLRIKWTKSALKINYEGGPTHNLVQILLGDRDRENFSEMEIYRVVSRIYSSGKKYRDYFSTWPTPLKSDLYPDHGKEGHGKFTRLTWWENTGAVLVLLAGLFLDNCELTDQNIVTWSMNQTYVRIRKTTELLSICGTNDTYC